MAPMSYLAYKRDTRYLLKWMLGTSNRILQSLKKTPDKDAPKLNTTGAVQVSEIVAISTYISRHAKEIPPVVCRLLENVISTRRAYYDAFQALLAESPDLELERSNQSHKYIIDVFQQAFDVLGGRAWQDGQNQIGNGAEGDDLDSILHSKFAALEIPDDETRRNGGNDKGSETDAKTSNQAQRGPPKKSKKGGKGKKSKTKFKNASAKEVGSDHLPLESYRIIEASEEGIVTDYLIGTYAIVKEWTDLRAYVQRQWRAVAYNGEHSVVAAVLTHIAIAMIRRMAASIFIDFPGPHVNYKTVVDTVTRGDPEKPQLFSILSFFTEENGSSNTALSSEDVDVKEQLLIHTYQNLLDFIHDFQKQHSDKPTKAMQRDLNNWDPDANLERLCKEERLQWRRCFTINWLYDFVNVFTNGPVMENKYTRTRHDLSRVDWSINGPWWNRRTLWGLKDFAADITHWAYQRHNTDNSRKILPHHVFELSCVVDSLTVSRGWSLSRSGRHKLEEPAQDFSSTREIDLFLNRDNWEHHDERYERGINIAINHLQRWLSRQIPWVFRRDPPVGPRNKQDINFLSRFRTELVYTLGRVGAVIGRTTERDWSRFDKVGDDGIWKYSPFLCGAGLVEALEINYRTIMGLWDHNPEPFITIHLYNMLLEEGYLDDEYRSEIYLFTTLRKIFADYWFIDGKAPKCDYSEALEARMYLMMARSKDSARPDQNHFSQQTAFEIQEEFDFQTYWPLHCKSHLVLYREAGWIPERIRDADLYLPSTVGLLRLGQSKSLMDPGTGERKLEDTQLVKQARALGTSESSLIGLTDLFRSRRSRDSKECEDGLASAARKIVPGLSKDSDAGDFLRQLKQRTGDGKYDLEGVDLLRLIKLDIEVDVAGLRPLSDINYMWITFKIMMVWKEMEDRLCAARNRLYIRAYEERPREDDWKRGDLANLAMRARDDECLRIMAECIKQNNTAFAASFFWENDRSHLN